MIKNFWSYITSRIINIKNIHSHIEQNTEFNMVKLNSNFKNLIQDYFLFIVSKAYIPAIKKLIKQNNFYSNWSIQAFESIFDLIKKVSFLKIFLFVGIDLRPLK